MNRNDILNVFDAVRRRGQVACSLTASITSTLSFLFTSATTITGAITATAP